MMMMMMMMISISLSFSCTTTCLDFHSQELHVCHNATDLLEHLHNTLSIDTMTLEQACFDTGSTRLVGKDLLTMNTIVARCMRTALKDRAILTTARNSPLHRVMIIDKENTDRGNDNDHEHRDGKSDEAIRDEAIRDEAVRGDDVTDVVNSNDTLRGHLFKSFRKRADSIEREVDR